MGDDKSTGLDGYTAAFFKEAWDIMSTDVTKVVKEFFINESVQYYGLAFSSGYSLWFLFSPSYDQLDNEMCDDYVFLLKYERYSTWFLKGNEVFAKEGRLPVKYMGVHLISSRLVYRDCKELIEKVWGCIHDWKNKSLSTAGRPQLIRSVIGSMHIYWASVLILPSRILLDIEQLMRGLLWCQGDMCRGKAKVALDVFCLSKKEEG
nr:reverse transcriptase domain, reverse transcriptase zinc-binding domain protein [Tanacetum cinerariifolium]